MEPKCEYSSMQIPNDPKYAAAAAAYVSEIARTIGMPKQDLEALEKGIIEAIRALIAYSFEAGERGILEIFCERIPQGFKVSLRDKGLPFGAIEAELSVTEGQVDDIPGMAEPIAHLKEYLDEIRMHNLGTEGKELVLIKHLKNKNITDYYAACDLEPYEPSPPPPAVLAADRFKCRVRRLKPDDAAEVSKTIYKTYGYTYPHDYVYYPDQIVALNESGRLFSAVAVAGDNEIAGYSVFKTWQENPQIIEMAQGVVKPEFRSLGCFSNLTRYLLDQARSRGIKGAFGEAVTNHTVSQHTVHGFGFKDIGLRLGLIPANMLFKGMNGKITYRGSMLVEFLYLQRPPHPLKVYVPRHHRHMIAALYEELGVRPEINKALPAKKQAADATSIVKIKQVTSMNYARMIIERYGRNIVGEIKSKVKEICLQTTDIINLYLNLSDPLIGTYTAEFENLGFFFSGILPGGFKNGEALILQYLNNVPIEYDAIQVESAIAKKLVAYVRKQDPNL